MQIEASEKETLTNKRVHPFSTYAKFSEKLLCLTPLICTHMCAYQGVNVSFFGKFCVRSKWMIPKYDAWNSLSGRYVLSILQMNKVHLLGYKFFLLVYEFFDFHTEWIQQSEITQNLSSVKKVFCTTRIAVQKYLRSVYLWYCTSAQFFLNFTSI